mmetsp:Transcript_36057/g.90176  ORF Transcript_36057/g.90176 Transcript_36057/m.90176 type:complete len:140 (+) Transcript_36057:1864-2283(+)
MQAFLRVQGFYNRAVDGDFGQDAVKALQEWHNHQVTAEQRLDPNGFMGLVSNDRNQRSTTIRALQRFLNLSARTPFNLSFPPDAVPGTPRSAAMRPSASTPQIQAVSNAGRASRESIAAALANLDMSGAPAAAPPVNMD